jgi:hypothetical protein
MISTSTSDGSDTWFLSDNTTFGVKDAQQVITSSLLETPQRFCDGPLVCLVHIGGLSLFDDGGRLQ